MTRGKKNSGKVRNIRVRNPNVPVGFCNCGCNGKTAISNYTCSREGYIKGWPRLYLPGHSHKKNRISEPRFGELDGRPVAYIDLPCGGAAIIDPEDVGKVSGVGWRARRDRDSDTYYVVRGSRVNGIFINIAMHRVIMGLTHEDKELIVDHINYNGLDNRRGVNLRIVNRYQSAQYRRMQKSNTSGHKGVSLARDRQKWQAEIGGNGVSI
jgi:hypothetical protein